MALCLFSTPESKQGKNAGTLPWSRSYYQRISPNMLNGQKQWAAHPIVLSLSFARNEKPWNPMQEVHHSQQPLVHGLYWLHGSQVAWEDYLRGMMHFVWSTILKLDMASFTLKTASVVGGLDCVITFLQICHLQFQTAADRVSLSTSYLRCSVRFRSGDLGGPLNYSYCQVHESSFRWFLLCGKVYYHAGRSY